MSLTSFLYRAARLSATARAVRRSAGTGNPKYAARRAKNILVGRALRRVGFWRAIFGR
jgi:hypothetical protein